MPPSELEEAKESGEEFTEQKTITDSTGAEITIPKGYRVTEDSATLVDDGVVISDAASNGNEWVWVPVKDPSIMYEENTAGVALSGSTVVTTTKYSKDILPDDRRTIGLPGSKDYREPDLLSDTGEDNDTTAQQAGFSSLQNMAQTMVNEYNTMIASIEKYGGFYIGRYELTANGTKPGTVLTNTNWYTLYKNSTSLAKEGSNSISRMIWGAQWDVTCLWLQENGYDINNSSTWGNYSNNSVEGAGRKQPTGFSESWKANNVYDFAGNCYEWTQEAYNTTYRVYRGGFCLNYGSGYPATYRNVSSPTSSNGSGYTSRPTLLLNPYDQATTEDNYIGYYADIDDNGTVDGVIYADLAHAKSGVWNGDSWSNYSYSAETNEMKEYYIKGEHTESNSFGTKPVVAPVNKEDTRADRFYVMALQDVNPGTYYCWYDAAYADGGKLDKTVATNYNDFGEGREHTEYAMNKWTNSLWGTQNSRDMWGAIQTEVEEGWFVASKAEWSAFGDAFKITAGAQGNYGLQYYYWSSSQRDSNVVYYAGFGSGYIGSYGVHDTYSVRLSVTF